MDTTEMPPEEWARQYLQKTQNLESKADGGRYSDPGNAHVHNYKTSRCDAAEKSFTKKTKRETSFASTTSSLKFKSNEYFATQFASTRTKKDRTSLAEDSAWIRQTTPSSIPYNYYAPASTTITWDKDAWLLGTDVAPSSTSVTKANMDMAQLATWKKDRPTCHWTSDSEEDVSEDDFSVENDSIDNDNAVLTSDVESDKHQEKLAIQYFQQAQAHDDKAFAQCTSGDLKGALCSCFLALAAWNTLVAQCLRLEERYSTRASLLPHDEIYQEKARAYQKDAISFLLKVASCRNKIGSLLHAKRDLDGSLRNYQIAAALYRQLSEEPASEQSCGDSVYGILDKLNHQQDKQVMGNGEEEEEEEEEERSEKLFPISFEVAAGAFLCGSMLSQHGQQLLLATQEYKHAAMICRQLGPACPHAVELLERIESKKLEDNPEQVINKYQAVLRVPDWSKQEDCQIAETFHEKTLPPAKVKTGIANDKKRLVDKKRKAMDEDVCNSSKKQSEEESTDSDDADRNLERECLARLISSVRAAGSRPLRAAACFLTAPSVNPCVDSRAIAPKASIDPSLLAALGLPLPRARPPILPHALLHQGHTVVPSNPVTRLATIVPSAFHYPPAANDATL